MSLLAATVITAIATAVLAVGAIVTAAFAILAFSKQSREVSDQAKLLEVQSGQLDAMKQVSEKQATVLELQAQELGESLAERKREAEGRRSAQAARVFIAEDKSPEYRVPQGVIGVDRPPSVTATVHNSSEQPIYDVQLRWHRGTAGHGEPNPEPIGVIMPGDQAEGSREFEQGTNMTVCGAVVRFADAAGVRWLRRPDGTLTEQQQSPSQE